ncbi:unnamed protein product [Rotaria sp. Silwood1]|nr:unnamed protein product [Rotaria sp. Silwood1]
MEAENAPTIPSSKLRNDLATRMNLTDTQMAALPKATAIGKYTCIFFFWTLIERALYRARSKTLPSVPKDLSFDIPPEFKTTANAFPLCWALLNDKRSKSYKLVFDKLIAAAHNLNMKFCPRIIISDFESGLIKTMKVLSKAAYYDLAFKTDATTAVKSYDGLVSHLLQDDAYEKVYPSIGNLVLHDRLVEFIRDKNNWPDANSVGPLGGQVFKKPNGQQIDSSRRYLAVRDSADHIDLYVQITKGRNLGRFKMLTNEQEIAFLLKFGLEWMRDNGKAPIVKDFTIAVVDGNLFIPRERQELVSRTINANILISQTQSNRKIDVTRLGVTGAKPATTKTKNNASAVPASLSATSSSSSSTSFSNTNRKSRPATKTKHVNPTTSSVSRSATPSKSRNTSATSSDSHMNTSLTHTVKAKAITVPMTSTRSFAIKDKTKKTTTKTVDNRKKKNGTSNQPPSSVSRTDSESEEDEPAVVAIKTIANVKLNDARLTPVCQRLRQRKIVAATATATTKVSDGSGAAAKSSKGAKKADNNKRKKEDLDDDSLNGSSSKKSKKDVAFSTTKTKAVKK